MKHSFRIEFLIAKLDKAIKTLDPSDMMFKQMQIDINELKTKYGK